MIKKIVQIGDTILEKKAEEIKDIHSKEVQKIIEDLMDTVLSVQDRSAGLSAPQIGISKRICICRRVDLEEREGERMKKNSTSTDKPNPNPAINEEEIVKVPQEKLWEIMINPEIIHANKKESIYWEGCLSIGVTEKDTLYGPVARPDKIKIKYQNRVGEQQELVAEAFFAHVVQHEIDHLDGILFISRVENPMKNIWKVIEIDKYIDKYGEYPPID
jgi:peptide deformylase